MPSFSANFDGMTTAMLLPLWVKTLCIAKSFFVTIFFNHSLVIFLYCLEYIKFLVIVFSTKILEFLYILIIGIQKVVMKMAILKKIKRHLEEIKTLEIANASIILSTLYEIREPATTGELNKTLAWEAGLTLSSGQIQKAMEKLLDLNMVTSSLKEKRGTKNIYSYSLTEKGKKFVVALDKFLQELE